MTLKYDNILFSLIELHFMQKLRLVECARKTVPNEDSNVLGSRRCCLEIFNIEIEILVIHRLHYALIYDIFQIDEIHNHSSFEVDWPANWHLDYVIVSVAIWIVAFAENNTILFVRQVNTCWCEKTKKIVYIYTMFLTFYCLILIPVKSMTRREALASDYRHNWSGWRHFSTQTVIEYRDKVQFAEKNKLSAQLSLFSSWFFSLLICHFSRLLSTSARASYAIKRYSTV